MDASLTDAQDGQVVQQEGHWVSSGFRVGAQLERCTLGLVAVLPQAMYTGTVLI